MPDISLRYNPDGVAWATLVDSETGQQVEEFPWFATVMPDPDGTIVQLRSLDDTTRVTVSTAGVADSAGALDQALAALMQKATEAGYTVERAVLGTEQEEPTP